MRKSTARTIPKAWLIGPMLLQHSSAVCLLLSRPGTRIHMGFEAWLTWIPTKPWRNRFSERASGCIKVEVWEKDSDGDRRPPGPGIVSIVAPGYLLSLSSVPGRFCIASPGCTLGIKAVWLSLVGKAQRSIWNLDLAPGNTVMHAWESYFAPWVLGFVMCKMELILQQGYYRV